VQHSTVLTLRSSLPMSRISSTVYRSEALMVADGTGEGWKGRGRESETWVMS